MKKIMFNEIWKPITLNGCRLDVSNYGNVRFSDSKKPKAIHLNIYGYPTINIQKKSHVKGYRVHRLVALLFVENPCPDKYDCVNHKDEATTNNHADNLEWCDRAYNNNYGGHNARVAKTKSKAIIQYDLNGNKICEWKSATCGTEGVIWRIAGDEDVQYSNGKRVYKCDAAGNILEEYINMSTAAQNNNILLTAITNCVKGRSRTAGGFVWKLKTA